MMEIVYDSSKFPLSLSFYLTCSKNRAFFPSITYKVSAIFESVLIRGSNTYLGTCQTSKMELFRKRMVLKSRDYSVCL